MPQMDQIIVMKNGRIVEAGTYEFLKNQKESEFNRLFIISKSENERRKSKAQDFIIDKSHGLRDYLKKLSTDCDVSDIQIDNDQQI